MAEKTLPDGVVSLGNNDPTKYKVEYPNQKAVDKNGFTTERTLVAIFDGADGDYDLYEKAPLTGALGSPFYSYNAGSRTKTVRNDTTYQKYMGGFDGAVQFEYIDKTTKKNTLAASQFRVLAGYKPGDTSTTAAREANALANNPDFVGLTGGANVAVVPVVVDTPNTPLNTEDSNTALPPEDGQTSTPLTEDDLRDIVNSGRREGTFGKKESLQYPEYIPEGLNYDHIQISAYAYVPAGVGLDPTAAEDRYKNAEKSLGSVTLPMQPNFSESNSVAWGGDMLNAIQSELGRGGLEAINKGSNLEIKGAIDALVNSGINIINGFSGEGKQFIAAHFAGQAVKANIIGRATGAVINPNLELLFDGPKLRTFSFSFKLTPRNADEAKIIRQIIKFFKKNMAAQRSTSNLFLLSPNIFKLKYISGFGKKQNPYMNKIKPCALSAFNVNYTPDGSYMTYNDPNNPSMTSYDIGLSFSEIEPIYADEIKNTDDMSY